MAGALMGGEAQRGIRVAILVTLMLQNAVYTLLRRYSQGVLKETVSSSEVLLLGEVIKLCFSGYKTVADREPSDAEGEGLAKLWWLCVNSWKMAVLAAIYAAMNILSFIALRRIDAAAFTVCAQLKILTTAFFSVTVLQRHLTWTKWRALVLIVCASILVSTPSLSSADPDCDTEATEGGPGMIDGESDAEAASSTVALGYAAVLAEVTLSGFASIYFEKVIKATNVKLSIWDRNFQLALYSIGLFSVMAVIDGSKEGHSLGGGWSFVSIIISMLGAFGGILVD